jgi:hypothetical protein
MCVCIYIYIYIYILFLVFEVNVRSMKFCGFASAAGRMRVTVPLIMRAYLSPLSSYVYEYLYCSFCRKILINVRTGPDSRTVSGEHPPFHSVGKRVYSPQVKRPEAEVHQAPESSGEVKRLRMSGDIPPIPLYARDGQLDERCELPFRRQLRCRPCIIKKNNFCLFDVFLFLFI